MFSHMGRSDVHSKPIEFCYVFAFIQKRKLQASTSVLASSFLDCVCSHAFCILQKFSQPTAQITKRSADSRIKSAALKLMGIRIDSHKCEHVAADYVCALEENAKTNTKKNRDHSNENHNQQPSRHNVVGTVANNSNDIARNRIRYFSPIRCCLGAAYNRRSIAGLYYIRIKSALLAVFEWNENNRRTFLKSQLLFRERWALQSEAQGVKIFIMYLPTSGWIMTAATSAA